MIARNIPGCMAHGGNREDAMVQFLRAFFECEDYRHLNKMYKMNQVSHYFTDWFAESGDIKYDSLIDKLDSKEWKVTHEAYYNSIVTFSPRKRKVTLTIPKIETIPSGLHLLISKLTYSSDTTPGKMRKHWGKKDY